MSGGGRDEGTGAARLVWLNGPPLVGKRTLAGLLRDRWGLPVVEGEALGFVLGEGMPARYQPAELQDFGLWQWVMWRVGVEVARAFGLAVLPAGVYRTKVVVELLGQYREAGVDVLHVVLTAEDTELLHRIHRHPCLGLEGKRWALEHRRDAVAGLAAVREGVRLPTTGRTPADVAADLADSLVGRGWLSDGASWVPASGAGPAGPLPDVGAQR